MMMRRVFLPWGVLGLSLSLAIAGLLVGWIRGGLDVDQMAFVLSFMSVQIVGALLLSHKPDNAVGRVMSGLGLLVALQAFVEGYAQPLDNLPSGGLVLTWLVAHSYLFIFVSIGLLFFLFPTGSPLSARWAWFMRVMIAGFFVSLSLYVQPGPLDDEAVIAPDNPYALDVGSEIFDAFGGVGAIMLLFGLASSVVALIVRYRSSQGIARLQMKSFSVASACFAFVLAVNLVLRNFFTLPPFVDVILSVAFALVPLSIGMAILRYRLYEIDVFINRALVYGTLTASVIGIYLALVVALQAILAPVTGDSDIAVAASTLAVAALFRPLRARIQDFIDRRFYRRKYDAARALTDFSSRLRDEVEVDVVRRDVLGVVRDTLQPTHASIWINPKEAT